MLENETLWWMLQVEFQERYPGQLHMISQPMPRDLLLRRSLEVIPRSVRATRGDRMWGLADLVSVSEDVLTAKLTVRPPLGRIAEEPQPGVLEDAHEPRFFTPIVVHIPFQIIVVHRAPELSRFARSAKAFAAVLRDLLAQAIQTLQMEYHYALEVEAIAKTGSFWDWYQSLDHLNKIVVHYVGPNLPSRPGTLVHSIRETANSFRNHLRSETVDLVAFDPHLREDEVQEMDQAVAERKLRMRASGTRTGIGTNWSSKEKPEPETVRVPLAEEELTRPNALTQKIAAYLEQNFGKRQE